MSEPDARPVTVFVESRFVRGAEGAVLTNESMLAGDGWTRTLPQGTNLRLAGRITKSTGSGKHQLSGEFVALPYYVNARAMVVVLPRLAWTIFRLTFTSSAIVVKQPGIIGILAVLAATVRRLPIVLQVVGDPRDVLHSGVIGRPARWMSIPAVAATRWCVRRGDVVRYVTDEYLQKNYPPNKDAVAVACSDVVVHPQPIRAEEPRNARIISVGTQQVAYKGHNYLIEAVASLIGDYPDIELVLVGEGIYQRTLRRQCRDLGIENRVRFTGQIAHSEIRAELDASTIFAMPSLAEGMPRALIEAMARSLPCVSTRVGGIPELLPEHWCIPPENASVLADRIGELLADEDLREVEGRRNLERSHSFSGEHQATLLDTWTDAVGAVLRTQA
ncbi:glycosyltransferase involved in cell wall biosynthesis [Aeromicrobium panaciterrae]|uniref:Glycosyltransferase involved in cell wall biosynthesis n=1 Tax=Aeromicrobium panaciterrae TaxID=363861 RepID=A0ABU1UL78_9ACTN|nr:glycosyltransferase [Aeromicrobium panaciterrae]MDR7085927.1 glycosyltransferase involved in cell wall biosynthesis [Aeromicrobium panaciterrae]